MQRIWQVLLIASALAGSWLGMLATHESGHMLNGWLSGGAITAVDLPLIGFSQTHVSPNPHPQITAWGGAVWGVIWPLTFWVGVRRFAGSYAFLAAFFAGFCLIANGVYLAAGSFVGAASDADDAHELLRHGASLWQLLLFGFVAAGVGLRLWHGLGPAFGLGKSGVIERNAALVALAAMACWIVVFVLVGRSG